jgi:monofunctional biosynthetic peptidoglycan transglycosylase
MNTLLIAFMGLILVKGTTTLFDFSTPEETGQWHTVNAGVMGGISKSDMVLNPDGTATFRGHVSLKNNGGFASVRTLIDLMDQNDFKGVVVRVKGDGNLYSIRFRTDKKFDGFAYQAKIKTVDNKWQEFKIPFKDFNPTFRGKSLNNKPPLESKEIAQIGILIADKQSGNFEITLDWIKFYR